MKTKTFNLGYDLNSLYRTLRLLFCFTPCLQQLQLRSPRSGGITCFNLTIFQFVRTTHLLLSSHAPQRDPNHTEHHLAQALCLALIPAIVSGIPNWNTWLSLKLIKHLMYMSWEIQCRLQWERNSSTWTREDYLSLKS